MPRTLRHDSPTRILNPMDYNFLKTRSKDFA